MRLHDNAVLSVILVTCQLFFAPVVVQAMQRDSHEPNLAFGMIVMSRISFVVCSSQAYSIPQEL